MDSTATNDAVAALDILRVMELIPHRYPMLMIDRVLDVVPDKSAIGVKNVSYNEAFFQGHFPRRPVMPGVLIIEAMAQTAAVLVVQTLGAKTRKASLSTSCRSTVRGSASRSYRETLCTSMSRSFSIAETSGGSLLRQRLKAEFAQRRSTPQ